MFLNRKKQHNKKVYVGMSGGVDSSVAAHLLKQEGYDVVGVFIKIWHPTISNCDWKAEMRDAMRACAHLAIPFKMIDLSDLYFDRVIGYMISEYSSGRTPNPDVMCNNIIKFGAFYDWAMNHGADMVATGHYAQVLSDRGEYVMKQGVDAGKDQTYFLWKIKKEQLKNILFPVGKYTKKEIRKIADSAKLPNATKPDSQGLCFVGDVDIKAFLKEHIAVKEGDVFNVNGDLIGKHDGAVLYTLGERHGFTLNSNVDKKTPHFVAKKDIKNNTLTVTNDISLLKNTISTLSLEDVNIFIPINPEKTYQAMCRYHARLVDCSISKTSDSLYKITFKEPYERIAEGQSVVMYDKTHCVLGGVVSNEQ